MGAVYRARDAKLHREVALKVLLPEVAHDPERLARFRREAQMLAALNHPNIAQIHGLEDAGETTALVLELVEGPTLDDRIRQGAVPLDEARAIAVQIIDALDAAHEQGIVHRDLKPANVKVRSDGAVKVLDFGLAKSAPAAGAAVGASLANSPTITSPAAMTGIGVLLGTAAYMSPEQAKGRPADKRSDIWAFGCVLYEMLSGRRAFPGDDVTETLAAVIKTEPDWAALPHGVPAAWRRLLRRCLEKDPRARLRDIGDARDDLVRTEPAALPSAVRPAASRSGERAVWAAAIAAAVACGWLLARQGAPPDPVSEAAVLTIAPPLDAWNLSQNGAISPDGRMIALVAFVDGAEYLYLRQIAAPASEWTRVAGTSGARNPFWSPDSRQVAFFAQRRLKSVPVSGAPVTVLAEVGRFATASGGWGEDGVYFAAQLGPLRRVTPGGSTVVFPLEADEDRVRKPIRVPGTSRVVAAIGSRVIVSGQIVSVDTARPSDKQLLVAGAADPTVWRDWLLYVKGRNLLAQRLTGAAAAVEGEPVVLATNVQGGGAGVAVSVSHGGDLAYRTNDIDHPSVSLQWLDRRGQPVGAAVPVDNPVPAVRLSADGRIVAFNRAGDIWLWPVSSGAPQPFSNDPEFETHPVWRPGGGITWYNQARGVLGSGLGAHAPTVLRVHGAAQRLYPEDWSPDGATLLITASGEEEASSRDLYRWSRGAEALEAITNSPADEVAPRFSPDGRWIAYHADDSGDFEVFVRPASGQSLPIRVSRTGGLFPVWSGDGQELYFIGRTGGMYAARVTSGAPPGFSEPSKLFDARIMVVDSQQGAPFDVTPDGQRFIVALITSQGPPFTYIRNFPALLERGGGAP